MADVIQAMPFACFVVLSSILFPPFYSTTIPLKIQTSCSNEGFVDTISHHHGDQTLVAFRLPFTRRLPLHVRAHLLFRRHLNEKEDEEMSAIPRAGTSAESDDEDSILERTLKIVVVGTRSVCSSF